MMIYKLLRFSTTFILSLLPASAHQGLLYSMTDQSAKSDPTNLNLVKISQSLSPVIDYEWIDSRFTTMEAKQDYQGMLNFLDQLISAYPDKDPGFYYARGNIRRHFNDKPGAIEDYRKAEVMWNSIGDMRAITAASMIEDIQLDTLIDRQYEQL